MWEFTEKQLRQRVLALVQHEKATLGLQRPPRYMGTKDPIANHLGIIIKEALIDYDEGEYIPEDPPTIVLDTRINDEDRLNFTFFHEILHHLIRQDPELYSFLHDHISKDEEFKAALDRYCNIGAAEFLIPTEDVRKTIAERGFSTGV